VIEHKFVPVIIFIFILFLTGCQREKEGNNLPSDKTPVVSPVRTISPESISQDSKDKLLFYSDRTSHMEIYIMNSDGSNPQRLTYYNTYTRSPDWSPDGKEIVFESTMDSPPEAPTFELYIMNLGDFNITRLTTNEYDDCSPAWSPDGKSIVFMSDSGYIDNYSIFIRNLEDGIEYKVVDNGMDNRSPAWSPEGDKIVFSSNLNEQYDIYITDLQGLNITPLTDTPLNEKGPRWSPDGTKIAYWVEKEGEQPDIYVIRSDGTSQTRLTTDPSTDFLPFWSLDGKKLYFSSNRTKSMDIYEMDSNGGEARPITDTPGVDLGGICRP